MKFSSEIRLGEIIAAISILGGGIGVYSSLNADMALIKSAQAAQVSVNREIKEEFKELRTEQKEQGQAVRRMEDKMNRARM